MPAPRQPIEIREFPRPDLPAASALLKTERAEVCGTDVHLWHGRLAGVPYPIIPGHVSAGVLAAIRGPLQGLDGAPLREGDRAVFFDVHRTCGRCRACTVHRTPTRCSARRVYGITDSAAEGLFGGWAQAIFLEPGVGIARLPDAVSFDDYIGAGCGLLTAVHILERAALRPGDTVLVQGVGAVGLSAIALARLGGASTVFAIGAPPIPSRSRTPHGRRPGVRSGRNDSGAAARGTPGPHPRRRRGRGDRSRRLGPCLRGGTGAGARRRTLRRRRPLHGRWTIQRQRAPAHQSQASRDPRLLGQRGGPFPARAGAARRSCRGRPMARDRRARLPAHRPERGAGGCRGDARSPRQLSSHGRCDSLEPASPRVPSPEPRVDPP